MQSRNYLFRLPESGLVFSANRYFPESGGSEDGLTFVFHHSAAARKLSDVEPQGLNSIRCSQGDMGTNNSEAISACSCS